MSIRELHSRLINKEISAVELVNDYFEKIKKYDHNINSFITLCQNRAVQGAAAADERISKGDAGLLCGIPLSVKDNICTKNIRTTCASKMLEDFVPFYDATVVEKLIKNNAVITGKTNMDEFAMGSDSGTSYFGRVCNPYDISKIAGGSSGGSAASVSAGFCVASLGSDTGGSVRQPAAYCGITGLKPTYGAVSRYGLIAFASSLDQIGICATCADDAGIILDAICGRDERDMTSSAQAESNSTSLIGESLRGKRVGIVREFTEKLTDSSISSAIAEAVRFYQSCGCEIVDVSLPSLDYAVSAYYLLSSAEAASNLSRYDGIKYGFKAAAQNYEELIKTSRSTGFGKEVKRRILLGNYALSSGYYDEYYNNALKIRHRIIDEYDRIFSLCDVIITPTTPTAAPDSLNINLSPAEKYTSDIFTVTANIAGIPSITTPCGYTDEGLPIGMSITSKAFSEAVIISFCDTFEKSFKRQEAKL